MVSSVALCEGGLFSSTQSYGWQADMYYTYILESEKYPDKRYIGHSANLKQRLQDHNAGKCSHTSKYRPWKIKLYVAFEKLETEQHFGKSIL